MFALKAAVLAAAWVFYAVDQTIGAATIAAVASIVNTWLLIRHERRVHERFDERRVVVMKSEDGVTIANEERRALEERRED